MSGCRVICGNAYNERCKTPAHIGACFTHRPIGSGLEGAHERAAVRREAIDDAKAEAYASTPGARLLRSVTRRMPIVPNAGDAQ